MWKWGGKVVKSGISAILCLFVRDSNCKKPCGWLHCLKGTNVGGHNVGGFILSYEKYFHNGMV